MIGLTERAAEKVKEFIKDENKPGCGLRLAVVGGGCSGFSYQLGLDEKAGEGDQVFENHGVKVFVDPNSYGYLKDTEVDFVETALGGGFAFKNPNSKGSCGCGHSFEV